MARHGENIRKRKDGRWEARYIQGYRTNGKAMYRSVYGRTYQEVKRKRQICMTQRGQQTATVPLARRRRCGYRSAGPRRHGS